MKLAIFVSGNLGLVCLEKLYPSGHEVSVIFTDKNSTDILNFGHNKNISIFSSNPRKGKGLTFISSNSPIVDAIVSVNYLYLIENDLIQYPQLAAINFHGSLLPKYRGRTPHVWAIINNEQETGITAHFIIEECDAGPVIDQIRIPIAPDDTGGSILLKYLEHYPCFVAEVVNRLSQENIQRKEQNHSNATYFGKRTPESGAISWSWQRERIFNWVRAQAFPYPGAFCFDGIKKIIIDKIEFCDLGYNFTQADGLILYGGNIPVIKTPNGAIRILKTREPNNYITGNILT